jgi:hypothetical protein
VLVEAGGQLIHGFRHGPDYAFIRPSRMRSVLSSAAFRAESWGSLDAFALSESMSLYRARLRLARFVPLGVTMLIC